MMLDNKAAFAHLQLLNLEANHVSKPLATKLKGLCKEVRLKDQKELDPDITGEEMAGRYVSVGE
jgi:hypothetical protein